MHVLTVPWGRYCDIPRHFVWKDHSWQQRQRGTQSIGRMYVVGCQDSELFYLRRILCIVRGATSFMDLRSYMGATYTTFKDACAARGMLQDDAEYVSAMQDMCDTECSVDSLRRQFASLLIYCRPTNGNIIFEMFLPELCGCDDPTPADVDCTLWALEGYANEMGSSLAALGFRLPSLRMIISMPNDNIDVHCHNRDVAFALFSQEQHAAAALIMNAIEAGAGGVFYIQASGGCGKSFWANGVCAALRAQGLQPIVAAASALAATVLNNGRTAHATFGIPIDINETSWCHADATAREDIIRSCAVFWDECSMVHKDAANCVERSLRDWVKTSQLFGGKVMVFMGDFRQLLPVVKGGSGDTATLMNADWWPHVQVEHFTRNFRSDVPEYCTMLEQVGMGELDSVSIPSDHVTSDQDAFCARVFGGNYSTPKRHVVCLTLDDAASINSHVISLLPGRLELAVASDVKINCKDPELYNDEFVQSLHFAGTPPAVLELKIGARC